MSANTPPAFIVGFNRSGTTLLRIMLDSHPNISAGPETHFLVDLKRIFTKHWDQLRLYGFDEAYWYRKIAEFFSSFQEDYARRRGKVMWVEKTPAYTLHLDFIERLFPGVKIIHIVRNPYDVIASVRKRAGYIRALKSVILWKRYVLAAMAYGRRSPNRFLQIKYEDLVAHPEAVLKQVLAFLEQPWNPAVLEFSRYPHDVRNPDYVLRKGGVSQTSVGRGKRLDPLLKLLVRFHCGRLIEELGYR